MKRGDLKTIIVDGKSHNASYLGKGHYTTAYRVEDTVFCFTCEGEYMKDVICDICDKITHVPDIKKHEDIFIKGKWFSVYSMPYYPNITKENKKAWAIYNTIRKIANDIYYKQYCGKKPLRHFGSYFFRDTIEECRGKVPESVILALSKICDAASNYGCGVTIEVGKRNIGVDNMGNIIFRDVIFDTEKLYNERTKVRR